MFSIRADSTSAMTFNVGEEGLYFRGNTDCLTGVLGDSGKKQMSLCWVTTQLSSAKKKKKNN